MRVPGDGLFATGFIILGAFVTGLLTGHSYRKPSNLKADAEEKKHALIAGD